MKKEYYLGLIVLVILFLQFKAEESKAQITYKKVTDTIQSLHNPVVETIGNNFAVVSGESPKGVGNPKFLSFNLFSDKLERLLDTTFLSFPVSSSDISVASDQSGIYVAHCMSNDISLMKISSTGNIIWSTLPIALAGLDNPISLKVSGTNLFMSGRTDAGPGGNDAFFSKLDLNGNIVWTGHFEGFAATTFELTASGNYFVLVRSFDPSFNVVQKVYLLDSSGSEIWSATLPSGFTATATTLDKTSGLLTVALKEEAATSKIGFLTIDELQNVSSVHLTSQKGSVVKMKDSHAGFIIAGNYEGTNSGAYAVEYDMSFNQLWFRKEPKNTAISKTFTDVTEKNCGFVFVGNQQRAYEPGSTSDLILSRANYNLFPSVVTTPSGSTAICPGQSVTISVPFSLNTTYVWKKYGNVVAGATSNSITVNSAGKYKVIATSQYGCSKTSATVNVTIATGCRIASLDEPELEKTFKFYPNPASNQVTIESELGDIQVFNSIGALVLQKTLESTEENLDISGLNPGVYFVKMGQKTLRLVKE